MARPVRIASLRLANGEPIMRTTQIRKKTVAIASPIANAYIDFSKMTCSVVAVVTDVVCDGTPLRGCGFNSNGRYGQGCLIRIPVNSRLSGA